MDIFEKKYELLHENEKIFNKYKIIDNIELEIPDDIMDGYKKKGRELLSKEKIDSFIEIRSIYYFNIINYKLEEYGFFEWVVCLNEKVLLEYAIPIFYGVLKQNPMLYCFKSHWEILYEITEIDIEFWEKHQSWYKLFFAIFQEVVNMRDKSDYPISKEYLCQFESF